MLLILYAVIAGVYTKAYFEENILYVNVMRDVIETIINGIFWPLSLLYFIFKKELKQ